MNILFITSELSPINSDSGIGHLVAHLGGALSALGHRVMAVVPLRTAAVVDRLSFARRLSPLTLDLGGSPLALSVYDGRLPSGIEVKVIEHQELFSDRPPISDDEDEPLRHAALAHAALRLASENTSQNGEWHVLHSFDLPAALAPFLAPNFEGLGHTKRVLSLAHIENIGRCDRSWVERLGLSWGDFTPGGIEFYGDMSIMKAGLVTADRLLMSGPSALSGACAIKGEQGLEGVMSDRRSATAMLPPGLDFARWNPATDVNLAVHYDAEQRDGKVSCKAYLQNRLELPIRPDVPLVALAPPLSDLAGPFGEVLDQIMRADIQLIAPNGLESELAGAIEKATRRSPRKLAQLSLNDITWHHVLAGADILILDAPREYDADLLLAAQRYGALPIVRAVGLARDLVVDLTNTADSGNGFLVYDDSPKEVLAVIRRACATLMYGQPIEDALSRIMSVNCSWEDRARKLEQLYTEMLEGE